MCFPVNMLCASVLLYVCGWVFLTSGRKLLGVDDFGSIFLSRGDLYAPPDHRKCAPEIKIHTEILNDVLMKRV